MILSRRDVLRATALSAFTPLLKAGQQPAQVKASQALPWKHGVCLLGDLKYPATFKQFDYVNANAKRGGLVRRAALGTFDSFNMVVAGLKGDLVEGIELIYDPLMASSLDEAASVYGLIAEAARYPADFSWVSFRLRAAAKWHDGRPILSEDVLFSLKAFRKYHPQLSVYYRHVVHAEKIDDREVKFHFDAPGLRELPQVIGQLLVLPQHWWEGTDKSGKRRDISKTTLEPPLGSGAYRVKQFEPDRYVLYERVPGYWANEVPVNVGSNNFQELQFDYFRDPNVAFEAFKAGVLDWRAENAAKNWATGYDFPAASQGRVVLEKFPIRSVGMMQAFAMNLRRPKFGDRRVRRAFNFAFDFERLNEELFYGEYSRIDSYFDGTELACSGLPQGRELELLQPRTLPSPARGVYDTLLESANSGQPSRARQSPRGDRSALAGRVRDKGPCSHRSQHRKTNDRRIPDRRQEPRAGHLVLSAATGADRDEGQRSPGRRHTIHQPSARMGLRHHRRQLAGIAHAGQ